MREWRDLVRQRLSGFHLSPLREQEIVEELSLHLEQRCDELMADGTSHDEARRIALNELSGPITLALDNQPRHQVSSPSTARNLLLRDAKYAVRQLVRDPVFSIVAMLSLALGVGATIAVFTVSTSRSCSRSRVRTPIVWYCSRRSAAAIAS